MLKKLELFNFLGSFKYSWYLIIFYGYWDSWCGYCVTFDIQQVFTVILIELPNVQTLTPLQRNHRSHDKWLTWIRKVRVHFLTRQDRLLHPLEYLQRVQHQSGEQITENEIETCTTIWDMPVNTKKEIKFNQQAWHHYKRPRAAKIPNRWTKYPSKWLKAIKS